MPISIIDHRHRAVRRYLLTGALMPGVTPPGERFRGASDTNPNSGPGWIPSAFSASYLAGFALRHPPGL
jgi:hypothetical protein